MESTVKMLLSWLVSLVLVPCPVPGQSVDPPSAASVAAEEASPTAGANPILLQSGNAKTPSAAGTDNVFDLAALFRLLGQRLDDTRVRDLFVRLNQGAEPDVHIAGNASIGESRMYFFPYAGVIVCATDYSGAGQRIGLVTLVGESKRVVLDGREYAVETFRGSLPLSLKWGELRTDILKRLGCPAMSNDDISISDRPKTPIHEARDADEFQQGNVIIRLIYTDPHEGPSCLEEIDLQRTIGPTRP